MEFLKKMEIAAVCIGRKKFDEEEEKRVLFFVGWQ